MMEQNPDVQDDLGTGGRFKNWLQDNIRIILSVLIVLAIAGGIYSYSKRSEAPVDGDLTSQETQTQTNKDDGNKDQAVTVMGDENKKDDTKADTNADTKGNTNPTPTEQAQNNEAPAANVNDNSNTDANANKEDVKIDNQGQNNQAQENQSSLSEETGDAFSVAAVKGDSKTTLARKAIKDYLEKNNDSSLTAEHKIYIEDYLAKHESASAKLQVGQKVSFSKDTIKAAVDKSKTLNQRQLDHLKIYSSRVSNL